jgi:hypothetical protein
MGSHRGIQIRKLFEPQLFPGAVVLPVFDQYFGPFADRSVNGWLTDQNEPPQGLRRGVRRGLGAQLGERGGAGPPPEEISGLRLEGGSGQRWHADCVFGTVFTPSVIVLMAK